MWVVPGVTQPGSTCARPVNLLDIYPTLAGLTDCEPPEGQLEGNDLSVLMTDPEADWNDATVTTFGYKNYGVRSERYRYIVYEDGSEELYDHNNDKWEWRTSRQIPSMRKSKHSCAIGFLPTMNLSALCKRRLNAMPDRPHVFDRFTLSILKSNPTL